MFDGILKPKLYTKSKSHLKITRTRLEAARKKKSSVFKYLKNDVADLLRNGLDYNAYGRAEGLLIERNMLCCYDLINSFCETISNNLSLIYKQRECPEECKEAVPSLMYAAARFADLPELRELRNLFSERYGNSLEVCMNEEFAEKLKTRPPSKEVKLQLLKEIAEEFAIEWNSKALEQRLYVPPSLEKPASNFKDGVDKSEGLVAKDVRVKEHTASERIIASYGSKEVRDNDSLLGSSSGDETTEASSTTRGSTDQNGKKGTSEEEEEPSDQKPFYYRFIPPPYLNPKIDKQERSLEEPTKEKADFDDKKGTNHRGDDTEKPKPRSVRRRNLKPPPGRENLHPIGSSENRSEAKEDRNGKNSDEEERILDGLLTHYSQKQPTDESSVKDETYLKPPRRRHVNPEAADSTPPARASSLPAESTSPTDSRARHARANSLEPETVGHVHPKLPDYEELAARFAALRGK